MSFTKNMGKKHGSKHISKNLSREYSQKFIDHTRQSATVAFKTPSKSAIRNPAKKLLILLALKLLIKLQRSKECHQGIVLRQLKGKQ